MDSQTTIDDRSSILQPRQHFHPITFFTNYANILFLIAQSPDLRIRDLSSHVGITERAAQRIIEELTANAFLTVSKKGRRNSYQVQMNRPVLVPWMESISVVGDLLGLALKLGCNSE